MIRSPTLSLCILVIFWHPLSLGVYIIFFQYIMFIINNEKSVFPMYIHGYIYVCSH